MHVTLVEIAVCAGRERDFIVATRANHEDSVREAGNLRFDVLQDPNKSTRFLLYEAYRTEADALAHKTTAHYLTWRDAVAEMMATPRQGHVYHVICPQA